MTVRRRGLALGLVLITAAAIAALSAGRIAPDGATAASHREAPLISLDPPADISDFFLFRSYEPGKSDRLVLIMNVNPGEEPSSGPNYYGFDPSVTSALRSSWCRAMCSPRNSSHASRPHAGTSRARSGLHRQQPMRCRFRSSSPSSPICMPAAATAQRRSAR